MPVVAIMLMSLNSWSAKYQENSLEMEFVDFWQLLYLKTHMVGHGGCSAGLYLTNPTSPIPSHYTVIIMIKSVPVHQLSIETSTLEF